VQYFVELNLNKDELTPREEHLLYTRIWNFCEEQCLNISPPIRFNKVKEDDNT
jgi:DNA replication initiation complex subunit (GINS family)